MASQTNEAALEACIERHLTGGVNVMPLPGSPMSDDVGVYQTGKGAGYLRGSPVPRPVARLVGLTWLGSAGLLS